MITLLMGSKVTEIGLYQKWCATSEKQDIPAHWHGPQHFGDPQDVCITSLYEIKLHWNLCYSE